MYQNIFFNRKDNTIFLWDDEIGLTTFEYKKYAFRRKSGGFYKSLYGDELEKVYDYDDREQGLFESDVYPEVRCLIDAYEDSDEPSKGHRLTIIDIETSTEGGFPNMDKADKQITAIALYDQIGEKYYSYVLDPDLLVSNGEKDGCVYKGFRNEENLLTSFLDLWETINPTIVSGWSSNSFDLPYLYTRIKNVIGISNAVRLSPVKIAYLGKFDKKMRIAGVSCMDYIDLYKKFIGSEKPSYSLGNVAKDEELKHQKLTYKGSLEQLYKEDLHRFIEYNLVDVKVVVELDKKYDFIYLARSVCHKGHIPYEWFQMSSRFIDGAILMYLKRHGGLIAPNKPVGGREEMEAMKESGEDGFVGAYVKEPVPGLYDWIYSADITSLYPSVIMSLNISPETKVGKVDNWDYKKFVKEETKIYNIGGTTYTHSQLKEMLKDCRLSISSNGVMYSQKYLGVVPTILDTWFKERVEYRELAKKYKSEGNKEKEEFYDRRQKRQKIFLNCFSPDTRVITQNGIFNISELKIGDIVPSLNRESGKTEWKRITRIYDYDYEGDLIHFESHHFDFLTTPNHRFWISKLGKKDYKPFNWEYSGEIINDKVRRRFPDIQSFPSTYTFNSTIDLKSHAKSFKMDYALRNNGTEIGIKRESDFKQKRHTTFIPRYYHLNDWLEFLGWFISEGSLSVSTFKKYENENVRGVAYKIHIAQEKYHSEVKQLLLRMRIPFYENERGFTICNDLIFKILQVSCGDSSETKKIPSWVFSLDPSMLRFIYKSLMMSDGHKRENCYTTKSKQLKDDFIRLCFHIGDIYAFLRDFDGCYRIQINNLKGKSPVLKHNHRKVVPYKGKVYCVEVEDNHTLLCGRNDKYQWCGQSVYGTLGLPVFRFYDRDNAEATTISGQTIIRSAEQLVNHLYLQKYIEVNATPPDYDFVKYIDTDSVTGDCILQFRNGSRISISKFFSDLVNCKEITDISGRHFKFPLNVMLPYFDENDKTVKYGNIEYIEKHRTKKKVFLIKTKSGKSVKVTEDHSTMVMENGRLIKKIPSEIKKGDKIISLGS